MACEAVAGIDHQHRAERGKQPGGGEEHRVDDEFGAEHGEQPPVVDPSPVPETQHRRDEYQRALDLYDRANRLLLKDDPSEVELYEARRSIEEGRERLAAARDALGSGRT